MRKKIIVSILCLFVGVLWITSFNATPPPPPPSDIPDYEYSPPIVDKIWVQKLSTVLGDGSNMIMQIKFFPAEPSLPTEMRIYHDDNQYIIFHDDGVSPDVTSGDKIYGAYYIEDTAAFASKMVAWETTLTNNGSYLNFIGHSGYYHTDIPHFDIAAFNNFEEVEISAMAINGSDCGNALLKQNSLFITDLSVVEDSTRTYNMKTNTGTPTGVWTFGTLMKNMAGSSVSVKDFIKNWLKTWMVTQIAHGQTVPNRDWAFRFMIEPWLKKAKATSTTVTTANWEIIWDDVATTEANILKYAPFKLTAISNRIDLRGNSAYANPINNAGETRFIFSLISTYTDNIVAVGGHELEEGYPPKNGDQQNGAFPDYLDWIGMNVIFEFGNVQTTRCDVKSFGQAWLDLSQYTTFPNSSFNNDLETITNTVTSLNSAPGKLNGSAINRIRTNERIFQVTAGNSGTWKGSDWQFRQFEIDSSGYLKQMPLTNTPRDRSNWSETLGIPSNAIYSDYPSGDTAAALNLIDWVFSSSIVKMQIARGQHNIPKAYPTSSDTLLAGAANVHGEYAHHLDLKWESVTTNYNYNTMPNAFHDSLGRVLRQQLSLNTCQGCHSGETKTIFTQIMPLAYGESANYWGSIPANVYRSIDVRFGANTGNSGSSGGTTIENYPVPSGNRYFPKVSAFLTGRNYSGQGTFQDDFIDATDDATDSTMNGLFYVYDPTNGPFKYVSSVGYLRWGYNDLERRKKDLCALVNNQCDESVAVAIKLIRNVPFAVIRE